MRVTLRGPVEHAAVELRGELDFATAEAIAELIESLPHQIVTIDAAELTFIDSAGVQSVNRIATALEKRSGIRPMLVNATEPVRRTFDLVGRHARARIRALR